MLNLILITLLICILTFSTIYSFLPSTFQSNPHLKILAEISTLIILIYTICQIINEYQSRIFASVSKDGTIKKSKNWPWKISKIIKKNQHITFVLDENYIDKSKVSVSAGKNKVEISNGDDGLWIEFLCPEKDLTDFIITIKR